MLEPLARDLWVAAAPQSFLGLHLGTRMTVVRRPDGGLLLYSPISATEELRRSVDALGTVQEIVAPNLGHHLYAGEWKTAYPNATLFGAAGLEKRRPDLSIDNTLDVDKHSPWQDDLVAAPVDGTMLHETVLFHTPTRTLICADLIENFAEPTDHWVTNAYLRIGGIYQKSGLSRGLRPMFRDKKTARKCIDRILEWDAGAISLAHGQCIQDNGREAVRDAYTWLRG